jgi:hypothetical protein
MIRKILTLQGNALGIVQTTVWWREFNFVLAQAGPVEKRGAVFRRLRKAAWNSFVGALRPVTPDRERPFGGRIAVTGTWHCVI